jgi:hypothetical protein
MLARWQRELNIVFDAVFLCGDVGTFTDDSQLDSATRSHAKDNPCELEFLRQWSTVPQAPWLDGIFQPEGLGLACPVVMVHGNHEGFAHLRNQAPRRRPAGPVGFDDLPTVDTNGHIRLLPTGWWLRSAGGRIIAGIGGMEAGQRKSRYHPMAYIDDDAVTAIADAGPVDVLITHQGPSQVQGGHGSPTLDLLDAGTARHWFHGHGTPNPDITDAGPRPTTVVPLGDIAFAGRGKSAGEPGRHGWSYIAFEEETIRLVRETPAFFREYRRQLWRSSNDGRLVCPDLIPFCE